MLSKRPIIQACVPVFKVSDRTKPVQNFALDLRMSKDDINKDAFICRLRFKEGLNTKSSELGLGSSDVVVGYSQKSPNGPLCNFVESITNSQWEIAVEKAMRSCEQTPKLILAVKLLEVHDNIPCQDFQDRIALTPQKTSQKRRLLRALIKRVVNQRERLPNFRKIRCCGQN